MKENEQKQTTAHKVSAQRSASLKIHHQMTLSESLSSRNVYKKEHSCYKEISRKLAIFIGSTNTPTSIVENLEFKDLLHTMDSSYPVPGRVAIGKELDKVMIELKAKISSYLLEANKISICADIWSKKGMSSSYLGVTGHFFSRKDHRRHCVTLVVHRMPESHTGDNIRVVVQSVLDDWDIHPSKIKATLTDNSSNMIAALRPMIDANPDESDDEDVNDDDEDGEWMVADFEEREVDHQIAFTGLNRVSCFAHTLQLVVQKFDELPEFKSLLKRAHSLVSKFNTSVRATEKLIA